MATLFFNCELLLSKAKNNPDMVVRLLKNYYLQKLENKYIHINLAGKGWLLEPRKLFNDSADNIYKTQYIILAAKRDFTHYRMYKSASLLLSYYPDLLLDKIKTNPLLTITKTEITFKYEE